MKHLAGSIVLFAVLLAPASAEQFHKWQDENGVWHYSTAAPTDQASTAVEVDTFQPATPPAAAATLVPAGPDAPATPATPASRPQPSMPAALADSPRLGATDRKANCERARTNVATLENYPRVTLDRDGDGQPETLSESEHLVELEKAREQMRVFCAPN